jgi:hypothetical protein
MADNRGLKNAWITRFGCCQTRNTPPTPNDTRIFLRIDPGKVRQNQLQGIEKVARSRPSQAENYLETDNAGFNRQIHQNSATFPAGGSNPAARQSEA